MQQWGFMPEPFKPEFSPVVGPGNSLSGRKEYGNQGSPYYGKGPDGREYYMPVTITYAEDLGTAPDGSEPELNKKIELPYVVMSVSRKKKVIDTELTERAGTASQLINLGNYEFKLYGFVIAKTRELPEEELLQLQALDELTKVVSVRSVLTDIYLGTAGRNGSYDCIIRDFTSPMMRGAAPNIRAFEMTMTSDLPFNLTEIV